MGKLGIFSEEKRKWIQFDEDTEVLVKHVNKEELNKIRIKAQKAASLAGADVGTVMNQRLGRAAVQGWRNINDPAHPGLVVNDSPLQFTPENLDMLMVKSLEFSNFVNEHAINSREYLEGVEETKNA